MAVSSPMQMVLAVTIVIGVSGSLLAWRERPEPGAVSLAVCLAGACWWTATLLFKLQSTTVGAKVFWVDVSWVGVAIIPAAWLFFCLSYSGYGDYVQPRYVALVGTVTAITAVLGVTNEFHHLLYTDARLVEHAGNFVLSRSPGPWFWVAAVYTYLLGGLGAIPLIGFLSSEVSTFRGQTLAILVGLVTPWATNVLYLTGHLPTGGIDPTPVAFSVSSAVFLGALTRFQLFETSPTPIRPARRRVFDQMEGGVIILDGRNNVVDLNNRAAAAVSAAVSDPRGQHVRSISPQFDTIVGEGARAESMVFRPGGGTETYEVTGAELTDTHGRPLGYIITLQDISEYIRQQQRLEVLNRVFRHNIRTNSQILIGHVEYLADEENAEVALEARETVREITDFSDKIREVLDVFERSREETSPVRLHRILERAVAETRGAYPDVTIHTTAFPQDIYVNGIADDVLSNVVRNAAQHNTNEHPEVWITTEVEGDGDRIRISVSDNGPGVHEEELALLREGSETPLNHGSGLGLALVVWGADILGGEVEFAERDPVGTVVTVELPGVRRVATEEERDAKPGPDLE